MKETKTIATSLGAMINLSGISVLTSSKKGHTHPKDFRLNLIVLRRVLLQIVGRLEWASRIEMQGTANLGKRQSFVDWPVPHP